MSEVNDTNKIEVKDDEIPSDVRAVLSSPKVGDSIVQIGEEFNFSPRQVRTLSKSVLLIFVGKISLDNFPYFLAKELGIEEKEAGQVAMFIGKFFITKNLKHFPDGEKFYRDWVSKYKQRSVGMKIDNTSPNTTADIRPVLKKIPKAPPPPPLPAVSKTNVRSEAEVTPKSIAPVTLKLGKLEDLENISARALDHEAQDESNLVDRLKTEIQNIANTSGAKRADIATSWKKSKLYKTYVNAGNESMQQNKNVAEVATFNKTAGKPYLTEPQFNAISEVSRLLLR